MDSGLRWIMNTLKALITCTGCHLMPSSIFKRNNDRGRTRQKMKKTEKPIVCQPPDLPEPLDFLAGDLISMAQERRALPIQETASLIIVTTEAHAKKLSKQRLHFLDEN